MVEQEKEEKDFRDWIESINFVDEEGKVLPAKLTEDDSYDPEYDRGEPSEEEIIEEEEEEEEE